MNTSDRYRTTRDWRVWLALLGIAIILVLLRQHSHGEPLERDITTYAYIAHEMLAGEALYSTLWDHKPPGVYWAYMLAEMLWGYTPVAITLLGIVFGLLSLLCLFLLLDLLAGPGIALLGAAFWALGSHSMLLQANQPNTELFLNAFTLLSLWSFARYAGHARKRMLLVSGLALAIASVFKTIAVFPMAAICGYLLFHSAESRKRAWFEARCLEWVIFLSPTIVIWGAVVALFAISGNLNDFYDVVFTFNRLYSGGMLHNIIIFLSEPRLFFPEALREVWILVLCSIAWLLVSQKTYGPLRRSFFLILLAAIGVEIAAPGRFYAHYYQLLLPLCTVLSALFFSDFIRVVKGRKTLIRVILPGIVLIVCLGHLAFYQWHYLKLSPEDISLQKYGRLFLQASTLAEGVRTMTSPCETIYEFGGETGVYYYAQRQAASGIFQIVSFLHSPQPVQEAMYTRILRDLQAAPPALFIWNSEFATLEDSLFSDFVSANYTLIATFDTYKIFEYYHRSSDPAC